MWRWQAILCHVSSPCFRSTVRLPRVITDGNLDVAVSVLPILGFGTPKLSILLGDGAGTLGAPSDVVLGSAGVVRAGDLNRDGKLDLAVAASNGVDVLIGNGDGSFLPPITYPTASGASALVAADFNGDGTLDLAKKTIAGNPSPISVLLGNGDGTFLPHVDYAVALGTADLATSDVNGDGFLDLVTAGGDLVATVLLGRGDGTFGSPGYYPSGGGLSLSVGDFNNDGRSDLAIANQWSNTVSILPQVRVARGSRYS